MSNITVDYFQVVVSAYLEGSLCWSNELIIWDFTPSTTRFPHLPDEIDASVIDAEDLDNVSEPLHLDSSTCTPVLASVPSEPPQLLSTTNNASDINSPVPCHVKDCILKSISAIVDAATDSRNERLIEIVNNFQSALRNELNIDS